MLSRICWVRAGQARPLSGVKLSCSDSINGNGSVGTGTWLRGVQIPAGELVFVSLPSDAALTNGVGNFVVVMTTAANQTVTATDTVMPSITGTASVAVVPTTANHFTVSAPSSVTAGESFTFTVTAYDRYNNVATNYSGTVRFSSTDYQATLPGNVTLTNGTGTFNATLRTVGTRVLRASDALNDTGTGSQNINVLAAMGSISGVG